MGVFTLVVPRHAAMLAVRDGTVVDVLAPGRYRRRRRTTYERVDIRPRLTTVAPQEILTSDGITVRVTAAMAWKVTDPVRFTAVAEAEGTVYLAVQVALRSALATLEADAVVRAGRTAVAESVVAAAKAAGETVGIDVTEVVIKDIMLPTELRAAYAELVTVRQRAQAQLEAARAETAALRSMANGAKLLDDHPALAQLRMIQAAPYGTKIILGLTPDGRGDSDA